MVTLFKFMAICIENLINVSDGSYSAEPGMCQLRERLVIIAICFFRKLAVGFALNFLGQEESADFYIHTDVFLGEFPRKLTTGAYRQVFIPPRRAEFDYGFVVRRRPGRTEKSLRQRRAAEAFHPDGLIENSISHSNVRRVAFEFEGERSMLDGKRREGREFVIHKSVKKWALSVVV